MSEGPRNILEYRAPSRGDADRRSLASVVLRLLALAGTLGVLLLLPVCLFAIAVGVGGTFVVCFDDEGGKLARSFSMLGTTGVAGVAAYVWGALGKRLADVALGRRRRG